MEPSTVGQPAAVCRKGASCASNVLLALLLALWFGGAATGLWVLAAYDNAPGQAAARVAHWPGDSHLSPDGTRATLVMVAHPHCTCTTASLAELTEILARATTRPRTYVLFLRPRGLSEGWEQTHLWRTASALPDHGSRFTVVLPVMVSETAAEPLTPADAA